MKGTLYTSGIGNISGMDCAHVPLWITYMGGRCWWLSWGVMIGFRRWQVPWEFWELLVVTWVMTMPMTWAKWKEKASILDNQWRCFQASQA